MSAAALDHLVYATPDLDATVADLTARLGVGFVPGGRHEGLGTRNSLAGLGDGAYLEVLGPDPEQVDLRGPRPAGIDGLTGPALLAWAVRVPDLDAAVLRARSAGFDPGPVVSMSRRRADGLLLQWRLTAIAAGVPPFLIDWGRSPHPSRTAPRGLRLVGLSARHPRPEVVVAHLRALGVDIEVRPGPAAALEALLESPTGRHLLV